MIGQDAVNTAEAFRDGVGFDGVVLSKLDGDARGGAAMSLKYATGQTIRFAGVGERATDLEVFRAERMASRILGMGDVLTLIEKAEQSYDQDVAAKAAVKLQEGDFTLEDFLEQMQALKKMGPLQNIIGMLPGVPKELKNVQIEDREVARIEAIIRAMTPAEREDPSLINGSRRTRIANGSGVASSDVNNLLKQFKEMQKMMKTFGKGSKGRVPTLPGLN